MLSRRSSSQAALVPKEPRARLYTLSLRAPSRNGTISSKNPRLPLELLNRIIECYFGDFAPGSLRLMHDHVKIVRLCCHAFNEAALRHVFATIVIVSSGFWTAIVRFLAKEAEKGTGNGRLSGFAWVRELVAGRVYNILRSPEALLNFTQLQSLALDFGSEGLNTQFDCVQRLFGVFSSSLECPSNLNPENAGRGFSGGIMQSLKTLKIIKLPSVNQHLLQKIACTFPNLVSLDLESTSRLELNCCSACYEDSLSLTMHSLVTRKFHSAEDLALTFGEALQPLTSLKSLYLGIFLTPEELVENHVAHVQRPRRAGMTDSLPDIQPAKIPSCAQCLESKLLQQSLLEGMRRQELLASLKVAQLVKSLEFIAWDSVLGSAGLPGGTLHEQKHTAAGSAGQQDGIERSGSQGSDQSLSEGELAEQEGSENATITKDFRIEMRVVREGERVRIERLGTACVNGGGRSSMIDSGL